MDEEALTCWICFELFDQPTTLSCSHTFCRDCLVKLYMKSPLCPFCRTPYSSPLPAINKQLEAMVEVFKNSPSGFSPMSVDVTTATVSQNSMLLSLPQEMVSYIFQYLTSSDVYHASLSCKRLNKLLNDRFLWRELCFRDYPFLNLAKYEHNWKKGFQMGRRFKRGWEQGKPTDFKMIPMRGHENYINTFSLFKNTIVSGGADNQLIIWRVNKSEPVIRIPAHNGLINQVSFNDVCIVSASADGNACVWDSTTGTKLQTLSHQTRNVSSFAQHNDYVITASGDQMARLFDIRTGQMERTLLANGPIHTVKTVSDSSLVTVGAAGAQFWNTKYLLNATATVNNTFSARPPLIIGGKVIFGGSSISEYSSTGVLLKSYTAHGSINCLAGDESSLVTGNLNGSISIYDHGAGVLRHNLTDHHAQVNDIWMRGKKIVSAGADNTIKVWEGKEGKRLYTLLGGSLQARSNNPPHPVRTGCSGVVADEGRIIGSFNSLLRVYSFEDE